jgi:ABC-2 type transport system permease protein
MTLLASHQLIRIVGDVLFSEVNQLSQKVRFGSLDYDLLRPLNSRIAVSIGRIRLNRLLELPAPMLLLRHAVVESSADFCLWPYVFLLCLAVHIRYSLTFVVNCLTFWVVETYGLYGLFDQLFELSRYPIGVFRPAVKFVLAYVMPILLLANVPARAFIGQPGRNLTIALLGHVVIWQQLANLIWWKAVSVYTAASS